MIGRRVRNVTPAAAARYIFGYTSAQDISDRTIQNAESQWARAKSFDTFTPLGPYVETKIDPHDLTIQLVSERAIAAELEHEPAHFQLLPTRQFHFDEHDSAARGYYSHWDTQRGGAD